LIIYQAFDPACFFSTRRRTFWAVESALARPEMQGAQALQRHRSVALSRAARERLPQNNPQKNADLYFAYWISTGTRLI
jgi:hypothetical protein